MADLFEMPKPGKRESRIGLDRIREKVARIERKISFGKATLEELQQIASLRRRLIRSEEGAREAWKKAFGQST